MWKKIKWFCVFIFVIFIFIFGNLSFLDHIIRLNHDLKYFYPEKNNKKKSIEGKLNILKGRSWIPIHPVSFNQYKLNLICSSFGFSSAKLVVKSNKTIDPRKIDYFGLNCPKSANHTNYCTVSKTDYYFKKL